MKKLTLYLLLFALLFSLVACGGVGERAESELLATVVGNNGEAVEIRKGMTWEQVAEVGAKSDTFVPILCMRDLQGRVVVAYAKDPKPLDRVYVFAARDTLPTRAECEEITAGMPMEEVIERLGVPSQYPKASFVTYYWKTQEGVDVIVRYGENFVVTSVEFINPSAES